MSGAELLALAERCEAAEWPERRLDADIAVAIGWAQNMDGIVYRKHPYLQGTFIDDSAAGVLHECRPYTSSFDAVRDIIPERYAEFCVRTGCGAWVRRSGHFPEIVGIAATECLSLCAAALRALAKEQDDA